MQEYDFGPVFSFCSFLASKDPGPRVKDKKVERGQNHFFLNFCHLLQWEMYWPLEHFQQWEGLSRMDTWTFDQNEICVLFVGFNIPTLFCRHLFWGVHFLVYQPWWMVVTCQIWTPFWEAFFALADMSTCSFQSFDWSTAGLRAHLWWWFFNCQWDLEEQETLLEQHLRVHFLGLFESYEQEY